MTNHTAEPQNKFYSARNEAECSLRPTQKWVAWSFQSESLHGLFRDTLRQSSLCHLRCLDISGRFEITIQCPTNFLPKGTRDKQITNPGFFILGSSRYSMLLLKHRTDCDYGFPCTRMTLIRSSPRTKPSQECYIVVFSECSEQWVVQGQKHKQVYSIRHNCVFFLSAFAPVCLQVTFLMCRNNHIELKGPAQNWNIFIYLSKTTFINEDLMTGNICFSFQAVKWLSTLDS